MQEIFDEDIWSYWKLNHFIVIPTNGSVTEKGLAVMGRGMASQAVKKFPTLSAELGESILKRGNNCHIFRKHRVITFPVKDEWYEKAMITLITKSAKQLVEIADRIKIRPIYMVRPGCGNGGLSWTVVMPWLTNILDDRFVVVEINKEEEVE